MELVTFKSSLRTEGEVIQAGVIGLWIASQARKDGDYNNYKLKSDEPVKEPI